MKLLIATAFAATLASVAFAQDTNPFAGVQEHLNGKAFPDATGYAATTITPLVTAYLGETPEGQATPNGFVESVPAGVKTAARYAFTRLIENPGPILTESVKTYFDYAWYINPNEAQVERRAWQKGLAMLEGGQFDDRMAFLRRYCEKPNAQDVATLTREGCFGNLGSAGTIYTTYEMAVGFGTWEQVLQILTDELSEVEERQFNAAAQ